MKSGFNPKVVWNLANATMGKGDGGKLPAELDGVTGDVELAHHVNKYYIDKIAKLWSRITPGGEGDGLEQVQVPQQDPDGQGTFVLRPPSAADIAREMRRLKNTGAEGIDGIPVSVLKMGAAILSEPIAHLVASSLKTCIVPSSFKTAIVTPIHKKKKPASAANSYRPVSILPALSKVLERVVHGQFLQHLDKMLPNNQHGFRHKRNTVGAIIAAHGAWLRVRSAGKVVGIVAYDLSSAFDTLDHDKLVKKMKQLGIRGMANSWFRNYLSDRSQQVNYYGVGSIALGITYSVPQGSILGPLLFLCLLVDLPDVIRAAVGGEVEVGSSGYADDCFAWVVGNDAASVRRNMELVSDSTPSVSAWTPTTSC